MGPSQAARFFCLFLFFWRIYLSYVDDALCVWKVRDRKQRYENWSKVTLGGFSVLKSLWNATLYSSTTTFTIHLLTPFVWAHSASLHTKHRSPLTWLCASGWEVILNPGWWYLQKASKVETDIHPPLWGHPVWLSLQKLTLVWLDLFYYFIRIDGWHFLLRDRWVCRDSKKQESSSLSARHSN